MTNGWNCIAESQLGKAVQLCCPVPDTGGGGKLSPAHAGRPSAGGRYGLHVQAARADIDATVARQAVRDEAAPGSHVVGYGAWSPAIHEALVAMQVAHPECNRRDALGPYPAMVA